MQLGLKSLCASSYGKHIRILSDNMTTVSYINHMGGSHSINCDLITRNVWEWCIERSLWLSAAHLPGSCNIDADVMSRSFTTCHEWQLNPKLFNKITKVFGVPDIDLFATRLNAQLSSYVSWFPDPYALFIDAFSISWKCFMHCRLLLFITGSCAK